MKNIKNELKSINWTKPSDVAKQTGFVALCITIGAVCIGFFDAGVQFIIGLFM